MPDSEDPQLALLFSFFENLFQKGPGSAQSTLAALARLQELPPNPRIVDFGCGSGAATLVLAKALACSVTAVEMHRPFLNELRSLAVRAGVADRITTVQADMGEPPFPDESFDLIWCEAAIYNIGFEEGLKRWRRLLAANGYVAVSEVSWLTPSPPQQTLDFWQAEYPAITSIEDNLFQVRAAGYETAGHFVLPPEAWENYYGPLASQLEDFRVKHATNEDAQAIADSLQNEVDMWRNFGESYGYVFYFGQAAD